VKSQKTLPVKPINTPTRKSKFTNIENIEQNPKKIIDDIVKDLKSLF
jgi:hypothetical protein